MATVEDIKAAYKIHTQAGVDFYDEFRAKMALDVTDGKTSIAKAVAVEKTLKPIKELLLSGDWRSALYQVDFIPGNVDCPKALLDEIKSDIQAYVTANF